VHLYVHVHLQGGWSPGGRWGGSCRGKKEEHAAKDAARAVVRPCPRFDGDAGTELPWLTDRPIENCNTQGLATQMHTSHIKKYTTQTYSPNTTLYTHLLFLADFV
jgi:hypothetical protein